ncbi:glycoside hydrolase family 76 protein [Ascoidea rubescens DSM 1968]|uniref:Glycoside hydrolase family 76 protein n=1 Tax=Ascoidea rubescens DSM 1968 TaxID=1344418 RepID=A0A1D2VCS7_9ASCO|nr:glycoside hydrolase family 76 protein [Ascoidea rubescens DSM 1968]ODV59409.1 glycoside hydrolase family 76 protein [Ascoidea rubescens DSM 1968]
MILSRFSPFIYHSFFLFLLLIPLSSSALPLNLRPIHQFQNIHTNINNKTNYNHSHKKYLQKRDPLTITLTKVEVVTHFIVTQQVSQSLEINNLSQSPSSLSSSLPSSLSTLSSASISSTLSSASPSSTYVSEEASLNSHINIDPAQEGANIIHKLWQRFWDDSTSQFLSDPTCSDQRSTHVVWDTTVTFQAIADAEILFPTQFSSHLSLVYNRLQNYKNSQLNVYSASTNKDLDIYLDDNAQIASAFITAFEATNNETYLNDAITIVNFLSSNWDTQYNGGVYWKYQHAYRASISTSESALAALRIYRYTGNQTFLDFGAKCMDWILETLLDPSDNLIYDGITAETTNKGKLSYHVGTALSATSYLHRITGLSKWQQYSEILSYAATSRETAIYYRDLPQLDKRFWNNPLKYSELLFEGLAEYLLFSNPTDYQVKNELLREARYIYKWLKSDDDGLYFQTTQLNKLTQDIFDEMCVVFETDIFEYDPDPSEYCDGDTSNPIKRTLLATAAAARIFLQTSLVTAII